MDSRGIDICIDICTCTHDRSQHNSEGHCNHVLHYSAGLPVYCRCFHCLTRPQPNNVKFVPDPAAAETPSPLRDRPEVRRWLSNVIYAFVHDEDVGEPTEAEVTAELDVLAGVLAGAQSTGPATTGGARLRVGRKVGRTIYDANDQLIGVMDTPALAAMVVAAVNRSL
jgi:hypothetical protein